MLKVELIERVKMTDMPDAFASTNNFDCNCNRPNLENTKLFSTLLGVSNKHMTITLLVMATSQAYGTNSDVNLNRIIEQKREQR